MALSDVGLCSRALVRIGGAPLITLTEGSAESEIAQMLYGSVRDALLSAYAWSFASTQVSLTRLSEVPLADYSYAYALPNDFLRALSVGSGARGRGQNYRIQGGVLHCNAPAVILSYVFRPEEEAFPPYFDQALIARLSAEFCIPITENTSRAENLYSMAEREFQRARQIDAQQDTPGRIENFTLVDVRE